MHLKKYFSLYRPDVFRKSIIVRYEKTNTTNWSCKMGLHTFRQVYFTDFVPDYITKFQ